MTTDIQALAHAVVSHWNEFGPEYGFDEVVDQLRRALVAPRDAAPAQPVAPAGWFYDWHVDGGTFRDMFTRDEAEARSGVNVRPLYAARAAPVQPPAGWERQVGRRLALGAVFMTDEQMQLIEDCEARESLLSNWDRDFLDSIKNQLADGKTLTQKQSEKLGEVWERATEKG